MTAGNGDLLNEFGDKVEEFMKFQGWADTARSLTDRFSPEVIEKVAGEHSDTAMDIAGDLLPLTTEMEDAIAEFLATKKEILDSQGESRMTMEELELRLAIEELTQEEFDKESKDVNDILADGNAKIAVIEEDLEEFQRVLERWLDAGIAAGILSE
ncbi:MAG: hypothetical protein HN348_17415 [Proteobacteria bacterium]|jgi:hypothetical protein|nr:hypothetical protein [Pseudomonadota bacterium]